MNTKPLYTPNQILGMRTATLRYLLTKHLASDNSLGAKITALVGFQHHWYNASVADIQMVAIAWAIVENDAAPLDHDLRTALSALRKARERALEFDKLNHYIQDMEE